MESKCRLLLLLRLVLFFCAASSSLLLAQCADDEQPLPALRSELMMVSTNTQGVITALLTDEGATLHPSQSLLGWRADTAYRVLATYQRIDASSRIAVRQLLPIPTASPISLHESEMRSDAVRLLALWKGGSFINLRFGIPKSYHGQHTIGWAYRGISQQPDGHRLLRLQLYHNNHNDRIDYDEEAYLSCPLFPFASQLTSGRDSIAVEINTTQGRFTRTFPY